MSPKWDVGLLLSGGHTTWGEAQLLVLAFSSLWGWGSTRKPLTPRHGRGFAQGLARCCWCQRGGCSGARLMVLGRDLQLSTSIGLEGSWVGNLVPLKACVCSLEHLSVHDGLFLVCL